MDDGLRGKDLQRAYWYNTHQQQVRTIGYGVVIGIVGIIWLINLIMLIRYVLAIGATNRAVNDLSNTQVIYDSIQAPVDLVVATVDAVEQKDETIDVYALINNPNRYHVGRFSYVVTVNGTNYEFNDGVVMPNAQSYVVVADLAGAPTASADLVIKEITWERVRGPQVQTDFIVNDLKIERSNLSTVSNTNANGTLQNSNGQTNSNTANSNLNSNSNRNTNTGNTNSNDNTNFATPDEVEGNSNEPVVPTGATITQVAGSLTNASAYGFRRVVITAIIKNPAGIVQGVQQQVFTDMASFTDYNLVFNWQRQFDFNVTAEVVVETNIWDDANLILPGQD